MAAHDLEFIARAVAVPIVQAIAVAVVVGVGVRACAGIGGGGVVVAGGVVLAAGDFVAVANAIFVRIAARDDRAGAVGFARAGVAVSGEYTGVVIGGGCGVVVARHLDRTPFSAAVANARKGEGDIGIDAPPIDVTVINE